MGQRKPGFSGRLTVGIVICLRHTGVIHLEHAVTAVICARQPARRKLGDVGFVACVLIYQRALVDKAQAYLPLVVLRDRGFQMLDKLLDSKHAAAACPAADDNFIADGKYPVFVGFELLHSSATLVMPGAAEQNFRLAAVIAAAF